MDEKEKRLFNAIKNDDLNVFSSLVMSEDTLSVRFGRFPILSLCYLYNSKKIIKAYEEKLIKTREYVEISEPQEIFMKFKQVAKKSLRLYVIENSIVSPLEMLAILEESGVLKHLYKESRKTDKMTKNIAKIYDINHNQIIKQEDDIIRTRRRKLPKHKILVTAMAMLIATLLIVAFPLMSNNIGKTYGDGSELYPYNVYTAKQFFDVLAQPNAYIRIKKDFIIDNYDDFGTNFKGVIDAEGHSITMKNYDGKTMFNNFSGKFLNCTINIENMSLTIKEDFAFLVKENNGEINGVNLNLYASIAAVSEKADGEVMTISAYAINNNGIIENCNVYEEINIIGNGKDIFYATFVANNKKTLSKLKILEGSKITAEVVDIAGIAYINSESSTITSAETRATMSQISSNNQWTPNVAGIVYENLGQVISCKNFGELNSTTTASDTGAFVGGIAIYNKKEILNSENNANLTAKSIKGDIYVGGIASYNYGQVTRCVTKGIIKGTIDSQEVGYGLLGGIAVENVGIIEKCVSGASFELTALNKYMGGISVLVLADLTLGVGGITAVISDKYKNVECYYLASEQIKNDNALLFLMVPDNGVIKKQLTDIYDDRNGVTRIDTMDALQEIIERLYETR